MGDEDVLTFKQLRDIRKKERDSDTLQELDEDFFEKVKDYLDRKKRVDGHLNDREYRNAKHMVEDILDSRYKKIIRQAFLATKSQITVQNLLPREEEFFDQVREKIHEHRKDIEKKMFEEELRDDKGEEGTGGEEQEEEEGEGEEESPEEDETEQEETEKESESKEQEAIEDAEEREEENPDRGAIEDDQGSGEELLFGGEDKKDEEEVEQGSEDNKEDGEKPEDGKKVEFLADVTSFMGVDMETYGPFEEGEEASIPQKNAEVLENQGKAEILES